MIFLNHLGRKASLDSSQDSVVVDGELGPPVYAHLRCSELWRITVPTKKHRLVVSPRWVGCQVEIHHQGTVCPHDT